MAPGKRSGSAQGKSGTAPRKRQVTIKDVAAHLGVSFSAVSRALNDQQHTSKAMKDRVRSAAAELGYVPNNAARMMHRRHSQLIGLVIPDLANQIFAETASIMSERCHAAGYQLILAVSQRNATIELEQVEALREMRVAGVIIAPCGDSLPETRALLSSMPVVQMARRNVTYNVPTIESDDRGGTRNGVRHLIQLGHRAIAVIGGDQTMTDDERFNGAVEAMADAGLSFDPRHVLRGPLTAEFGKEATSRLLQLPDRPTAILATNSVLTLGLVDAIHRAQIAVPQQMSIIGFGDPDWFRLWGPGLTTIQLPIAQLAEACAQHLLRQIKEDVDRGDDNGFQMVLDTNLLLRGSTGPVPSS